MTNSKFVHLSSTPSLSLIRICVICQSWRCPVVPVVISTLVTWHLLATFLAWPSHDYRPVDLYTINATRKSTTKQSCSRGDAYRGDFNSWVNHWKTACGGDSRRTHCRELASNAETCVFEGLICVRRLHGEAQPVVDVVTDASGLSDMGKIPSDDWCQLRFKSSNPRYYGSRHWPLLAGTVVPQQSCMRGRYRSSESLLTELRTQGDVVQWANGTVALLDVDPSGNDHNAHFALDTLWILDASLHDDTLRKYDASLDDYDDNNDVRRVKTLLNRNDEKLLYVVTQDKDAFERQTVRDLNRFMYAVLMRKDPALLYDDNTTMLHVPATLDTRRYSKPLLEAYPELAGQLHLQGSQGSGKQQNVTICTPRLVTGFKTGFGVLEPVCRHIRSEAYQLFGVPRPEVVRVGQVEYAQPAKSILVVNRHFTRKIANVDQVVDVLRQKLSNVAGGVPVNVIETGSMYTTEENVRAFASAGVVISPHGGQNQGVMFMQRHSALIELMAAGYTDYTYSLLCEPCQVWYFEFAASISKNDSKAYEDACGKKVPHLFTPCNEVKSWDMYVDVDKLFPVVLQALEHIGYDTGTWISNHLHNSPS